MDTYTMLLLTDSRFKTIKTQLDFVIIINLQTTVEAKPGANLVELERVGLKMLEEKKYHLVLICGGINDLDCLTSLR